MSDLQTFMLLVDNDRPEAIRIAEKTAQSLEDKKSTLIDVVQSLGEYINDEDILLRGKAVSYLTAVIKALPDTFLTRQQIQVLTSFYCDRIGDGGAIAGLDCLQGLGRFNNEMTAMTARALFENFEELQLRPQSQRFQIIQLLSRLMTNHREAFHEMGDESLVGIVDLVHGEKDPRNLMLVFSILKVIMVEWDISNHAQILFDSVYNYFPITFRPPPNDPYGITAQDLKDRLQDCIISTKRFAPYAFPALLDKLDATSPTVKKEALVTMKACIFAYDPVTVSRYSITIWDSVKFEILNGDDESLSNESLNVLQSVAKRLSEGPTPDSHKSSLAQYLRPITKECNEQLREPQQKLAKPAQHILRSLSAASSASFSLIIQAVVAPLFTVYQEADGIAKQRALLDALVSLFDSAIEIYGTWSSRDSDAPPESPLSPFQEKLSETFSQALMGTTKDEISFRVTALKGLIRLSTLKNFLPDNEIGLYVQYLDEILLKEEIQERDDLRKESISGLAEISKYKPQLIMDITFPAFVATLPDTDVGEDTTYMKTLESLAQISIEKEIFETLVRRLLSKLDVLLQSGNPKSPEYPRAILLTILYVMDKRGLDNDTNLDFYYTKIVENLSRKAALATMGDGPASVLKDATTLDTVGRLSNLIIRSLPGEKQKVVAENVYNLFSAQDGFVAVPFAGTTSESQRQTMILSTYFLAGLPKTTPNLPYTTPDMSALLHELVKLSISEERQSTHLALLRHVALLVNKFLSNKELASIMPDMISSLLPSDKLEKQLTPATIRTIFWLSKALILRLAPQTTELLMSLLSLLSSPDPQTSSISARGFAVLLSHDDILNTTNGATFRLLTKQRVFTTLLPLVSKNIRATNTSETPTHTKQAYLTALSGILSTIPPSLVTPEMPTLLPLLLQSLDLQGPETEPVKSATLETIAVLIRENGVIAIDESGHIESLINRLLKTATYKKPEGGKPTKSSNSSSSSSAKTRAQALQCIFLVAQTSSEIEAEGKPSPLRRLKTNVVRSLSVILDDPKRDVRKAAVDARGSWLRGVEDDVVDDEEDE
ncbi:hypothetical protein FQN54_003410 [Arachnomyces sp. PD_36]|nr:hypothetical protein FQN54_003410 [Arachnomyces sp. PD_36]